MNKGQTNLQDIFLNQVRKENVPVTVYLVTGAQLKGSIRGFDAFTVILESPGKPNQLVYKHALASVVPQRMFSLRLGDGAGTQGTGEQQELHLGSPESDIVEVNDEE